MRLHIYAAFLFPLQFYTPYTANLKLLLIKFSEKVMDKPDYRDSLIVLFVRKYEKITDITSEIMQELIDKIVVHAPDKSSGHREQKVEIHFRFKVAISVAVADSRVYDKRRKAA